MNVSSMVRFSVLCQNFNSFSRNRLHKLDSINYKILRLCNGDLVVLLLAKNADDFLKTAVKINEEKTKHKITC